MTVFHLIRPVIRSRQSTDCVGGPFSAVADVNGDGLEDIFIGGAANQSGALFIQTTAGTFVKHKHQPWSLDSASEDLGVIFLDVDRKYLLEHHIIENVLKVKRVIEFVGLFH